MTLCGAPKQPLFFFLQKFERRQQRAIHFNDLKKEFFSKLASDYVDVESDEQKLVENFNDIEKVEEGQKLTLGLLTKYNFQILMHNINDNWKLIPHMRFIINEVNLNFHHSVIISRF